MLLTNQPGSASDVCPGLALLAHQLRVSPRDTAAALGSGRADCFIVDARTDLVAARRACDLLHGSDTPVVAVMDDAGLAAMSDQWRVDDFWLTTAGPGEIDARLRRLLASVHDMTGPGGLVIDEQAWVARVGNRDLDLTYTEFELLKYLAQQPGRVFSREQILDGVWGVDYYGGTRTVDVHIRRLRAKLGPDKEALIGTVRNVGYRLVAD